MKEKITISDIVLDESIYPRERIDRKRVSLFAENMRDGFCFDPIVVEPHPDKKGKYRILDGAHRWNACREVGLSDMQAVIKDLKGTRPSALRGHNGDRAETTDRRGIKEYRQTSFSEQSGLNLF